MESRERLDERGERFMGKSVCKALCTYVTILTYMQDKGKGIFFYSWLKEKFPSIIVRCGGRFCKEQIIQPNTARPTSRSIIA